MQRFRANLNWGTLHVHDQLSNLEYVGSMPDNIPFCNTVEYMRIMRLVHECIATNTGYMVDVQSDSKSAIVRFCITGADKTKMELVINCEVQTAEDTIAHLRAALVLQESKIEVLARNQEEDGRKYEMMIGEMAAKIRCMHIDAQMSAKERVFGFIPGLCMSLAREVVACSDGDVDLPRCLAICAQSRHEYCTRERYFIDITAQASMDFTRALSIERDAPRDGRNNTCLLWIPSVVAHIDCYCARWSRIVPLISTARLIIGQLTLATMLRNRRRLEVHPRVRSVIIKMTIDPLDTWEFLRNVIHNCELIVPMSMKETCPIPLVGANITFFEFLPKSMRTLLYEYKRELIASELCAEDARMATIASELM